MDSKDQKETVLKKKSKSKPNQTQNTVLKQLQKQNRSPLRERIAIFFVASFFVVGLLLIFYVGTMVLLNEINDVPDNNDTIDIDLDNIDDMLDDLNNLIDQERGTEISTQDEDGLHEYLDNDFFTDLPDDVIIGVVNANRVRFVRAPGDTNELFLIDEGDLVIVIDLDYNAYWSKVEIIIDLGEGPFTEIGFVYRDFIDVE